ncbi:TPA: PTS transporter subunit EIIC [Streptococcus pyogenes]
MSHFSDKFMEISGKIGSQRHLVAIRDSFISMMPITMAGSVAVLLNVFLRDIPNNMGWTGFAKAMQPVIDINGYVYFGTIGIMALFFAFAFGYNLAVMHKINPLAGGLISFGSFIATLPQTLTISTPLENASANLISNLKEMGLSVVTAGGASSIETSQWGAIALKYVGATGLFTALIIGFLSSFVYAALTKRNITITLPDNVPPAVNKAFAAIIPGTVAIYASAIFAYLIFALTGSSLSDVISTYVIPWLIVPPICASIAYFATAIGLIPPVFLSVPWITPVGLYAYLATGGNIMAGLVSLFNLFVAFLIWAPFVILANKEKASDLA